MSQIGGKKTTLKVPDSGLAESLSKFGKQPLSELQISNVEDFLVKCYNQKTKAMTFDDLRYKEKSYCPFQRAYINTLNVPIINAICGLTHTA